MTKPAKKPALGRGISAIFGNSPEVAINSIKDKNADKIVGNIIELELDLIETNPFQPRTSFNEEELQGLASSIEELGVVQPITVRKLDGENKYQLISGERRFRASKLAGLKTIPAYIRTIKDESIMELALVENIQREDLNAIEIALAYEHLLSAEGMTQERVSERVGKSRTAITNYLRLLKLPAQVQMALQKKEIDMGHARALLAIDSPSLQIKLFREIQKHGYSVRKVEELAQKLKNGEDIQSGKKTIATKAPIPEEVTRIRQRLSDFLDTKVQMTCSPKGKGKISIPFANEEELARIMAAFDKLKEQQ